VLTSNSICEIFEELSKTSSLNRALNCGVRLACTATGCSAAALATSKEPTSDPNRWIAHYPEFHLDRSQQTWADDSVDVTSSDAPAPRTGINPPTTEDMRVSIPLRCGSQETGFLILWPTSQTSETVLRALLSPIDTALATLLAASGIQPDVLLTAHAFRARLASEIARSKRHTEGFSVIHIRVACSPMQPRETNDAPVLHAAQVGQTISSRLRESDAIGLLAPDHLAILLTATPPLGARIAQRRIEQLLTTLDASDSSEATHGAPAFCIKSFPGNGRDIDGLCQVNDWGCCDELRTAQTEEAL